MDQAQDKSIACKVCNHGTLVPKKVYRMSAPVVVIGFIFLVPAILGLLPCGLLLIAYLLSFPLGFDIHLNGITIALVFGFGVASFIGGLLGWLLVMKKRVLQCSVCNATISAS